MKLKIIIITICIIFLVSQTVNAADTNWKTSLIDLMNKYPSLFEDIESVVKNIFELLYKFEQDPFSGVTISDFPPDIVFSYFDKISGGICIPGGYNFYDLDFDGIPEVIINFGALESGVGWREIYRFHNGSYQHIGNLHGGEGWENLYINPENKIVRVGISSTQVFEIIDNEITYSDYIDSTGSDMFQGVKYSEIYNSHDFFWYDSYEDYLNATEFLADLKYIPEFDCSDFFNTIKYSKELSPKTDDNYFVFNITFITISTIFAIILKFVKHGGVMVSPK